MVRNPPATGNAELDRFLSSVKDELETATKPIQGWKLSDFHAEISEVISDKRDLIDIVRNWDDINQIKTDFEAEIARYEKLYTDSKVLGDQYRDHAEVFAQVMEWWSQNYKIIEDAQASLEHKQEAYESAAIASTAAELAVDSAQAARRSAGNVITPEDFGAKRDGVTDDVLAIEHAIAEAMRRTGGTVRLSSGSYAISRPIGSGIDWIRHTCLEGDGDQSAIVLCKGNFEPISGKWFQSTIRNLVLDANLKGGAGIRAHFDKVTLEDCMLRGWLGYGMFLNPEGDDIGLLNRIRNNHIVQSTGYGIFTTYRFVDSWIEGNNIGSTEANLSLEAGPIRAVANHLNGAPKYNIELRGNQRITISDNIMEGSRLESVVYNMPPWLSEDHPQIQIIGNAISNGGKGAPNTRPAIGIYGLGATKNVFGFNIVGNVFACQDQGSGWTYAVEANHAKDVVATGNQWRLGFSKPKPVGATASSVLEVSSNSGGNDIERN